MPDITRRDALLLTVGFGSGAVASAIVAGFADPDDQSGTVGEEVLPSSTRTTQSSPRELAAVDAIPDGGALDVSAVSGEPTYLIRDGDAVRAVSATCTHAGCVVSWQPSTRLFECPCHRGTYDVQGAVISGPPPRALDELPIVVEDGTVLLT